MLFQLLRGLRNPVVIAGCFNTLDYFETVPGQGFGAGAVGGVGGEEGKFVERAGVEVNEGGARGRVREEPGKAGRVTGFEVSGGFDGCEQTKGGAHGGWCVRFGQWVVTVVIAAGYSIVKSCVLRITQGRRRWC